ncbi:hypothetical protein GUJ93_ZPchr0007g3706 [Zizania palustris]|uniref:Uncharacterized protein n=1 Tax=Zizania palustris TaxID=103762 RepID=A0A8J5W6L5_ZIZPA|nr:hypothetical protein GUJ93_ZPchr0007g3706 [Zizania palustris]
MYHSQGQGFDVFVRLLREMAEYIGYAAPDYLGFVSSVLPYPCQMTVALFPLIPQLSTCQYTVTCPTLALAMQDVARLALGTPSADPVLVVHPDASLGIAVPVSAPASASASAPSAAGQSGVIDITDDSEEDPREVEVYPEGTEE